MESVWVGLLRKGCNCKHNTLRGEQEKLRVVVDDEDVGQDTQKMSS